MRDYYYYYPVSGIETLSKCRSSCRALINSMQPEPEEGIRRYLKLSGGAEDTYTDLFGYVHNICDLRDGFDAKSRYIRVRAVR